MRGTKDLLARLLLAFALMLAALPLRARVTPCAPNVRPVCAMGCCAKRKMTDCGHRSARKRVQASSTPCGCELKSAPAPFPGAPSAILSAFDAHAFFALPSASSAHPTFDLRLNEPGIVGADSGPPQLPPRRSNASRAPPFVPA